MFHKTGKHSHALISGAMDLPMVGSRLARALEMSYHVAQPCCKMPDRAVAHTAI